MGKIDIPEETSPKKSDSKTSEHAEELATSREDGFFKAWEEGKEEDAEITKDELNLTNEAIRLIDLKRELGLDATDIDHDKEVKKILSWAKDNGIKNRNQLYARIKEIKYKLGINKTTTDSLKRIYQYVVIDDQIKNLVNKQQAIEHRG